MMKAIEYRLNSIDSKANKKHPDVNVRCTSITLWGSFIEYILSKGELNLLKFVNVLFEKFLSCAMSSFKLRIK